MNSAVQDLINEWAGHSELLDAAMKFAAADLIYLIAPLGLALWFLPGATSDRALRQRLWLATVLGVMVALVLGSIAASLHSDVRPFVTREDTRLLVAHSPDNGFPSDHTTVAFAVAGTLLWWRRSLGLLAIVGAALIGFARVFVGVHWPVDILAGAGIGLAAGALAAQTVRLWEGPLVLARMILPAWVVSAPEVNLAAGGGEAE